MADVETVVHGWKESLGPEGIAVLKADRRAPPLAQLKGQSLLKPRVSDVEKNHPRVRSRSAHAQPNTLCVYTCPHVHMPDWH